MSSTPEQRPRRKQRRTWPQRLTMLFVGLGAFACFLAAASLSAGQWVLSQRNLAPLVPITTPAGRATDAEVIVPIAGESSTATDDSTSGDQVVLVPATTLAPIQLAEPDAANFLVVGADNNDCGNDRVSDERDDLGERSDTIMVWRANPQTNQLAVLSFPRDLYVEYPSGSKNRINAAFKRDDPSLLQQVLYDNFGIPVDHYIQVDFCAFRRLVSAVGGVAVPFDFPARDKPQNGNGPAFLVEQTGCVNLDGDAALAYVRSRHYQFEDPPGSGDWHDDPSSDFGRITRQQDFLRRVLSKVIDEGLYDPNVASALIATNREYVTTDTELTVRRMLEFANALRNFDPGDVTTYRIDSSPETTADGAEVEIPRIKSDNMKAILAVFRGEATIAGAPEQVFESTTTTSTTTTVPESSESSESSETSESSESGDATSVASTVPEVSVTENTVGVAPNRTVSCD